MLTQHLVKRSSPNLTPKTFNVDKHSKTVDELTENMSEKEFEKACEALAFDILQNYEDFERIEKGPHFRGTRRVVGPRVRRIAQSAWRKAIHVTWLCRY
jgi:hypothetical protein